MVLAGLLEISEIVMQFSYFIENSELLLFESAEPRVLQSLLQYFYSFELNPYSSAAICKS
jgi:hypothetical protein